MTDSQYSGYSPNGQPPNHQQLQQPHHHHQHDLTAKMSFLKLNSDASLKEESEQSPAPPDVVSVTPSQLKPRDIANYINKELRMPSKVAPPTSSAASAASRSNSSSSGSRTTLPANTRHPHQIWSRDKNGGLQYTGMLSSDC